MNLNTKLNKKLQDEIVNVKTWEYKKSDKQIELTFFNDDDGNRIFNFLNDSKLFNVSMTASLFHAPQMILAVIVKEGK